MSTDAQCKDKESEEKATPEECAKVSLEGEEAKEAKGKRRMMNPTSRGSFGDRKTESADSLVHCWGRILRR